MIEIKKLSQEKSRKILFTEYGYRNVDYAGRRPWTHDDGKKTSPNNAAQANLYEALYQSFWNKDWIAGGFSWKWFAQTKVKDDTTFTVQGKEALSVIQKWYGAQANNPSTTGPSQGH